MTDARRKTILRMKALSARTATIAALSVQVLGCDPMTPPAREPPEKLRNPTDPDAGVTPIVSPDGGS